MNDIVPLKELGLEQKWGRLAALQQEVASLTQQVGSASAEVQRLESALSVARNEDVAAQAKALRGGKAAPKTSREEKVNRELEAARRNAAVLQRASEDAQAELGQYRARHRAALYTDVVRAREEIARDFAKHAQAAAAGFGRWADIAYTLKDLEPPLDYQHDESASMARSSTHFIGVHTRQSSGPERGQVEAMLSYLASLAPDEEGASDAA